jgi:hypothetical protein
MTKDDADTIERAINTALAAQRAAFDARMSAIEGRAELFAAVLGLVSIVTDGPTCKARILDLQRQADQARDLQGKLASERTAFNQKVTAERAELDRREAALRKHEIAVSVRERELASAKATLPKHHDRRTDGFIAGSGLSRELDDGPLAPDAHYPLPPADAPFQPKPVRVS